MERVIIVKARPLGLLVCCHKDATDTEIKNYCDRMHPSGTTNGWIPVRKDEKYPERDVVKCAEHENRIHVVVDC